MSKMKLCALVFSHVAQFHVPTPSPLSNAFPYLRSISVQLTVCFGRLTPSIISYWDPTVPSQELAAFTDLRVKRLSGNPDTLFGCTSDPDSV